MKKLILIGIFCSILWGCAVTPSYVVHPSQFNGLAIGMTKDDVIRVVGQQPYNVAAHEDGLECFNYALRENPSWTSFYMVVFKQGKVVVFRDGDCSDYINRYSVDKGLGKKPAL